MIRPLDKNSTADHLQEILGIEEACFGKDGWGRKNVLLDLPGKWEHSFSLEEQNRIIAYIFAAPLASEHIHIYRFAVLQEFWRQGHGSRLLQVAISRYLGNGIKDITVETDIRFPLDEFYIQNQFRRVTGKELVPYLKKRNRLSTSGAYEKDRARVYRYFERGET